MATERRRWNVEKLGPYLVGIALIYMTFCMEMSLLTGVFPFTAMKIEPKVPAELIGRMVGWWEAGAAMFLAWLFQTSRSSQGKDEALAAAAATPKP